MGFFSSDTKKTTNTTVNEYSTSANTAISGGDSDIGSNAFVAANSTISNTDNSLALSMADYSARDYSVRTANSGNTDSSDNSFKNTQMDYSSRTYTDSGNTDSSVKNTQTDYSNRSVTYTSTDGGAFQVVGDAFTKFADVMGIQNEKILSLAGLNQKETLGTINEVTKRSMDSAFAAKAGSEPLSGNAKGYLILAGLVSVVAGAAYVLKRS